ncbi:MAG TPA: zinc ribbon domain-containing protein [Candidatus Pullilachnospira intestinigallinarum]|nr:zinc ribbon domain-containing protein [Candidatus Pullilachnospira intestinigallinarum]
MYCTQCGARIDEKELRCPYCQAVNPFADEQKYMERLQKILEETENLSDEPLRQYGKELKFHGKRTLKIALTAIAVPVAAGLILVGIHLWHNRQEAAADRARLELESRYLPQLETLYAQGDYEEASRLLDQAYEEASSAGAEYFSWSHATFLYYFDTWNTMDSFRDTLRKDGSYSQEQLEDALFAAMVLYQEALLPYEEEAVTSGEKEEILSWKEDADRFLQENLLFSPEEIEKLGREISDESGIIRMDDCWDYASSVVWPRLHPAGS